MSARVTKQILSYGLMASLLVALSGCGEDDGNCVVNTDCAADHVCASGQ